MDKEMIAKANELLKNVQGRRELSMEETEMVVGGGSFSTGVGPTNGNFGGLCQTTGCGEDQKFWIAGPQDMYSPNPSFMEVDEETFRIYYMGLRQLMPAAECCGRDGKSSYAIYP